MKSRKESIIKIISTDRRCNKTILANEFGISRQTLYRYINQSDKKADIKKHMTKFYIAVVRNMNIINPNFNKTQLANVMGVSRTTIYRIMDNLEITNK